MKNSTIFGLATSVAVFIVASRYAVGGQSGALVRLQSATPGVAQTGHLNITGTGLFADRVGIGLTNPSVRLDVNGQIRTTAFRLNSGGGAGKVLTSDASGVGTWQPVSLTLPYAQTGSSAGPALFEITNSGDSPAIRGVSSSPTGTGIMGRYDHATGAGRGVYGYSQSPSGWGVSGVNGSGGGGHLGGKVTFTDYYGTYTDQTGVHGTATGTGWGVVGVTGNSYTAVVGVSGYVGVYGSGETAGVWGAASNSPGVYGESSSDSGVSGFGVIGVSARGEIGTRTSGLLSTDPALSIATGSLAVEGAGIGTSTCVFTHRASAGNTSGHITTITHPQTNGDPNAILIITPNWNPRNTGGTYNNHATGVYYDPASSKWTIFNQDLAAIPAGAAFNVMVVKSSAAGLDSLPDIDKKRSGAVRRDNRP